MYQVSTEHYFLSLLVALLGFFPSYGQEAKVLKIPRNYRITFDNANYRLQVIDARTDTLHIGYSWIDPELPPKRFRLEDPLAGILQDRIVQPNVGSEVPVLFLKILKFELSYIKTNAVASRCEIVLDFIEERSGAYYLIDQASIIISGSDADKRGILDGFQDLIRNFNRSDKRLDIPVAPNELKSPKRYSAQSYGIQGVDVKTGVYSNFLEFRDNAPGHLDGYIVDWNEKSDSNRIRVKVRDVNTKTVWRNIWGFSADNKSYVKVGNQYFHLRPSAQRDSFDFEMHVMDQNNDAVLLGGILFGLAGGALAGALSREIGYQRLQLNLVSGEFSQLQDYDSTFMDSTMITVLRNSRSKSAAPMKVLVGGYFVGEFEGHAGILKTKVPTMYQDLSLLIRDFNGSYELVLDDISGGDRYVLIEEKKGRIDLRTLERVQADYHVGLIKKFEKRKSK